MNSTDAVASDRPILRPLRVGEILDRAIRLYRRHFLQFVGIMALVQIPISLVQLAVSLLAFGNTFEQLGDILNNPAAAPDAPLEIFGPAYAAGASLNGLVSILAFILVQGVATAALTSAVAHSYFGKPLPSMIGAYRSIKDKWFPVVAALLLGVALAIALAFWWLIPCIGWATGGGMLLFLWWVIIPLLAPIIILEDLSPARAWRRAWDLARRRFWWVLGFALILYLFNLLVVAGPAALVAGIGQFAVGDPFDLSGSGFAAQSVIQSLTTLITGLLYLPLQVASMTLLYVDLRVRTEGLDLALAADSETSEKGPLHAIVTAPAAQQSDALLTGVDWRNFFLVTAGGLFLLTLLYLALIGIIVAVTTSLGSGL